MSKTDSSPNRRNIWRTLVISVRAKPAPSAHFTTNIHGLDNCGCLWVPIGPKASAEAIFVRSALIRTLDKCFLNEMRIPLEGRIQSSAHWVPSGSAIPAGAMDFNGVLQYNSRIMKWQLVLNDILPVYIQGLYALRLWQRAWTELSQNYHFVPLAIVASLGTAIYVVYHTYIASNIASDSSLKIWNHNFFSTIAVTDLIIAIPMFYYLHKSRTIILAPSTAIVLLRLLRLVLMSGLATSACSLLTLISYILWPQSLAFLGIHFVLSKFYINSLLAMLNSRLKHHSTSQSTENEANSLPTVLRITPLSSACDVSKTNISIPLPDKLDPSKEAFDCQV
ncbi:hypothetical protein ARMGADRAFT_1079062 [Armillaria gallica]|uniref:DUF6534 domain-containing protein n=1 Tax=Armillaria gallica TaxID=47427 RepID=A0A2H3DZ57_ARMGA|nr:hypothetical protein ARMGADRAFT_1079062 [Armillaria gallica]